MVDFKKLVKQKRPLELTDLIKLFESLDRQTSHTELRLAQIQALQALSLRRNERDMVLKISTGAGKTAVALLYLLSHMEEKEEPAVYLCPTTQLVRQVHSEATKIGIKSVVYPAGETYPDIKGTSGKAIIICTYDKLFNAKSTFDRTDVRLRPNAIVLDDAHAGIEEIRDSFTLRISRGDLYKRILDLFDAPCKKYNAGCWQDITDGAHWAALEIPFWIWSPVLDEIRRLLSPYAEEKTFMFVWPFLRDMLRWCRCIISGSGIEIIPDMLPVHKIEAFHNAPHRLFMSATIADDSILVRELDCSVQAASDPILPKDDKGLGERMVLAPSLIHKDLDRAWVMEICHRFSKKVKVIVLSPSEEAARNWEAYGARVVLGDDVLSAVEELKDSASNTRFVVFTQRYDGIDLPDNACRILVIDGMPSGQGIIDKYDGDVAAASGGIRSRLIYRIEQGMGRAVRSHVDFAVIILAGLEIAHFVATRGVMDSMNPDTKAQLKLALDLVDLAKDAEEDPKKTFADMIIKCLSRDEGWKQFYNENVRELGGKVAVKNTRLELANAERKAFQSVLANSPMDAVSVLRKAINETQLGAKEKGLYLQRVSNYIYEYDQAESLETQRAAYEMNTLLFCSPVIIKRPLIPAKMDVQATIIEWYKQFSNPNGSIAAIQELQSRLSYKIIPETMENALKDLAPLLGARGSRPEKEYGEGPDDLWLWPSVSMVIEVKNENKETLHKKDAGQLVLSLQWFECNHPALKEAVPIMVAGVSTADAKSGFPGNTKVITPDKMELLFEALEKFYQKIISEPPLLVQPKEIYKIQSEIGLLPEQFIKNYTVPLKEHRR